MAKATLKAGEAATADADTMMLAERIYILSAPAGPRRRAGLALGPVPIELKWEDLGDDPETVLELLLADPMIRIDGRYEHRPADETDATP